MVYSLLGIFAALVFFALILFFIAIGHLMGRGKPPKAAFDITEGAIFTLVALLVTFTFSGASQRFDNRRSIIVEEANAISTAYLRLDMLAENDAKVLRIDFKDYLSARLAAYHAVPDFEKVNQELDKAKQIQVRLWHHAMQASKNPEIAFAPMLVIPAINNMFDLANARVAYSYLHPPVLVFILLLAVVLLSAFLTGYGMVGRGKWSSLHLIAFAVVTSITIYVIIDLEYPRLGFIQEAEFDVFLQEIQHKLPG